MLDTCPMSKSGGLGGVQPDIGSLPGLSAVNKEPDQLEFISPFQLFLLLPFLDKPRSPIDLPKSYTILYSISSLLSDIPPPFGSSARLISIVWSS